MLAPTLGEASKAIDGIKHHDTVIFHTAVNNLKSQNAVIVAEEYNHLLRKCASRPFKKIVLSLPTPSLTKPWNDKISHFKRIISSLFPASDQIFVCNNNNFNPYGSPLERFFVDDVHLSDEGTRLPSGNLIRTTFGPRMKSSKTHPVMVDERQNHKTLESEIANAIMR